MATETNPDGFTYDPVAGTPVDKATADNAAARKRETDALSGKAVSDAAAALGTLNVVKQEATAAKAAAQQSAASSSSSAAASNAAADTAERFGDDVELIKTMAGLSPGDAYDAATAVVLGDPDSESHALLNAQTALFEPLRANREGVPTSPADAADQWKSVLAKTVTEGKSLTMTPGEYLVRGGSEYGNPQVFIKPGGRWSLRGDNALVKLADLSATNWASILDIRPEGGDVDRIDISDMGFDGNRRGQDLPPGAFDWEQASMIRLNASDAGRFKYVNIRDVDFRDPIADCITSTWWIDTLKIHNMNVTGRESVRSDVQISSLPRITQISNFTGASIEFESHVVPATVTNDFFVQISQATCDHRFDINIHSSMVERFDMQVESVRSTGMTYFINARGTIANSELHFSQPTERRIYYPSGLTFTNCDIYIYADANGVVLPLGFYVNSSAYTTGATFKDSRFHLVPHPNFTGDTFTGAALALETSSAGNADTYRFENCWWDERFKHDLDINRTNTVELVNNQYGSTGEAIVFRGSSTIKGKLKVDGGDFSRTGGFIATNAVAEATTLDVSNVVQDAITGSVNYIGGNLASMITRSDRVILVDAAPPAWGLRGDRARLKTPVAGSTYEWVCTTSGHTTATWKALSSAAT